jgi:hypothetical protein
MTTVTKSAGDTLVTLLGTLGSAASIVSKTIDSASASVDMLDAHVQRAKVRQASAHQVEDANWLESIQEDAALERIKRHKSIASTLTSKEDRALFDTYLSEYRALFTPQP